MFEEGEVFFMKMCIPLHLSYLIRSPFSLFIKLLKIEDNIKIMTTYVICRNCGKKFRSRLIQIENLGPKVVIENNYEFCPHCNKSILVGKDNLVNE